MFTHHTQPVGISLGSKTFHLCPTFEDLSQIEKKLSTSILALAKKLSDGVISLEELVVVLEHSIENEAGSLDLKAAILEAGIAHVTEKLTALFVHLFKGTEGKHAEHANPPPVAPVVAPAPAPSPTPAPVPEAKPQA